MGTIGKTENGETDFGFGEGSAGDFEAVGMHAVRKNNVLGLGMISLRT